jgi:hypothetical protein
MTTVSSFKDSRMADDRRLSFDRVSALVAALAIVYGLALWLLPIPVETFDLGDTPSYLHFFAYRSAGYPWALRLCASVFGTPLAVLPIQIWAYAAAGFFAIDALWRRAGSRVGVAIAGAAIFGNPFVALFHLKLMTDSFSVSCLLALGGLAIGNVDRAKLGPLFAMGVVTGFAIAIRPSNAALVPALILYVGLTSTRSWRALGAALAALLTPVALIVALESAAYSVEHPGPRESLLSRHMFAKALLMPEAPQGDDPATRTLSTIHAQFEPTRALIATISPASLKSFVETRYETLGQWPVYDRIRPQDVGADTEATKGVAIQKAALASLGGQPWTVLQMAAANWWAQTYVPELMSVGQDEAREQLVAAPHPFADEVLLNLNRPPTRFAGAARGIQIGLVLASLAACLIGFIPLVRPAAPDRPLFLLAGLMGWMAQASMLMTAFFGVAVSRYSLSLWPAEGLAVAILAALALSRLKKSG